jgi:hypothetical protein
VHFKARADLGPIDLLIAGVKALFFCSFGELLASGETLVE